MPPVSEAQRRAMYAAAEGRSTLGIPESVGREFVGKDAAEGAVKGLPEPIVAAGIVFLAPGSRALFMQRGPDTTHFPGCWDLPGGKREGDETPDQTALREAAEEVGGLPKGELRFLMRRTVDQLGGSVDFSTFVMEVEAEFAPTMDDEHTAYAWCSVETPPEPIHPGTALSIEPLKPLGEATELEVAKRVSLGILPSPTMLRGMALFALRVTGTGLSYRPLIDEYVWRPPEHYLTPEFLERCAGLPVLWKHTTKKGGLGSDEFNSRAIGSVMFAYQKADEIWCVARIYEAEAIELMSSKQFSTSPGVIFGTKSGAGTEVKTEDGSKVLIENKPPHLDHLAIVSVGVWDKAGNAGPGVLTETLERADGMSEEEMADKAREDAARKDAEEKEKAEAKAREDAARMDATGQLIDKMMNRLDAWEKKMDSWEEKFGKKDAAEDKPGDPAETAADRAKKDAAEAEKKADEAEKKADAARQDAAATAAELADLRKQMAVMAASIQRPAGGDDQPAFAEAQSRFDDVAISFGHRAPAPMLGETPEIYRRRLCAKYQAHSTDWKDVEIAKLDSATLTIAERAIMRDAIEASKRTDSMEEGELVPITHTSPSGHRITEFRGRTTFITGLKPPTTTRVKRFNVKQQVQ